MAWVVQVIIGKDQGYISPRIQLDVSLLSGIHAICIPTFPFDPPTQSDTYLFVNWYNIRDPFAVAVHK